MWEELLRGSGISHSIHECRSNGFIENDSTATPHRLTSASMVVGPCATGQRDWSVFSRPGMHTMPAHRCTWPWAPRSSRLSPLDCLVMLFAWFGRALLSKTSPWFDRLVLGFERIDPFRTEYTSVMMRVNPLNQSCESWLSRIRRGGNRFKDR
jgi:hypothetical protein